MPCLLGLLGLLARRPCLCIKLPHPEEMRRKKVGDGDRPGDPRLDVLTRRRRSPRHQSTPCGRAAASCGRQRPPRRMARLRNREGGTSQYPSWIMGGNWDLRGFWWSHRGEQGALKEKDKITEPIPCPVPRKAAQPRELTLDPDRHRAPGRTAANGREIRTHDEARHIESDSGLGIHAAGDG